MTPLPLLAWSWPIDGWIVTAGLLCAVSSALLGNFLVLRRMSMLGDAISHAVLPGLAAAFLLTGERSSAAMFVGAVAAGLLTALFSEWVSRFGDVDEGASLGVVFTTLFAAGLILIVRAANHVDLDPGCVLYGAIELVPFDTWTLAGWRVPRVVVVLSAVLLVNALYVGLFFKELRIASFDPGLANTSGYPAWVMHYSLMALVAVTAVACFEAVGAILVVAMLVTPPAAARLLTDRLGVMVLLSAVIAAASALLGHAAAVSVPTWFGYRSTTTAGSMAVAAGALFTLALLFGPRQGVVTRLVRRTRLAFGVLGEDVLGALYRTGERESLPTLTLRELCQRIGTTPGWRLRRVLAALDRRGQLQRDGDRVRLTDRGAAAARELVRSHRLWESYLVEQAGVPADRIHPQAERFEHITSRAMRDELDRETSAGATDPHGQVIPDEPTTEGPS